MTSPITADSLETKTFVTLVDLDLLEFINNEIVKNSCTVLDTTLSFVSLGTLMLHHAKIFKNDSPNDFLRKGIIYIVIQIYQEAGWEVIYERSNYYPDYSSGLVFKYKD